MSNRIRNVSALLLAAAGVAFSSQAWADNLGYAVATDNWTFVGSAQVDVKDMRTNAFTKLDGKRLIVTFSAECAVDAVNGNPNAWLDVDIVLLNATTSAVVYTAAPTAGSGDAFCSSTGTAGLGHWTTHAVQALIPYNFAAGSYRVGVKARLNNGGTTGWLGERMVTVMQ